MEGGLSLGKGRRKLPTREAMACEKVKEVKLAYAWSYGK